RQFCLAAKETLTNTRLVVIAFQYPYRKEKYTWHDIPVIALGGHNRRAPWRFFTWLRAWRQLKRLRRLHQVKGVLSLWLGETALVGKMFARRNGIPHYTWLQGQDAKKGNRYARLVKPRAETLIAISRFNRDEYEKNHGVRPFMVAANGVRAQAFPPLNEGARDIHVMGAGSLIALKNFDLFVRIVHALKKEWPDIRAVVAGDGPEDRELLALSIRLGLQQNIQFTGALPHGQVLQLMNRSMVFLHPSSYEGLSTVVIEALYSGCKVVSALPVSDVDPPCFTRSTGEEAMTAAV